MPDLGNESIQVECLYAAVLDKMLREIFKVHRLQGEEYGSVFFDADTVAFDQFACWEVGVNLTVDHQDGGRLRSEDHAHR